MMSHQFSFFFFSSRRRHTRLQGDWSSDVCSSDLARGPRGRVEVSRSAGGALETRLERAGHSQGRWAQRPPCAASSGRGGGVETVVPAPVTRCWPWPVLTPAFLLTQSLFWSSPPTSVSAGTPTRTP